MNWKCTLPSVLSFLRIALAPLAAGALWHSDWPRAIAFSVCAAMTDFFDGWCARKFNAVSRFGSILDPLADKIFVGSCYAVLITHGALHHAPPIWVWGIFCVRELFMIATSLWAALLRGMRSAQPTLMGKFTMMMHMACLCLVACVSQFPHAWGVQLLHCGWMASSFGMVYSAWQYQTFWTTEEDAHV